jgi:hypothetical protein
MKAKHSWSSPEVLCALFAAIAAIGSCAVAVLQYNQSAKDTSLDRRPWLIVRNAKLQSLEIGKPLGFLFEVRNEGHTPAESLQTSALGLKVPGEAKMTESAWLNEESKLVDESQSALNYQSGPAVAPGESNPVRLPGGELVTQEEANKIGQGSERIVIFGQINYTDLEGKPGFTRFCSFVRGNAAESTLITLSCPFWNDMK